MTNIWATDAALLLLRVIEQASSCQTILLMEVRGSENAQVS